ncbi:MAG TPA: type II toxin-antitoxin system prevent-host-death family antitoxin [Lachnospiraceae bacterium]|nr:type II toxin-antitoxin system prevent-host-death family antitoxin [Lachnospiraceae bacterium]
MSVTAIGLKNNFGKYLLLSATEDIFITKNGKVMAKLTNPCQDRVQTAKSLFGILPKDANLEESKKIISIAWLRHCFQMILLP